MRIYRVERQRDRIGPFRHTKTYREVMKADFDGYSRKGRLPTMHGSHAGIEGDARKHYRIGVRTLSQLVTWFDDDLRERLSKRGFVVRVYEIDKPVLEDPYQVLAHIPKRKRAVATFNLTDIQEE